MITLRVVDPLKETRDLPFPEHQPTIDIGRSSKNHVPVADVKLSRFHASIRREENRYLLKDLGSYNGTYLNGELLKEPTVLQSGDIITAGETEIKVILSGTIHSGPLTPMGSPRVLFGEETDPSMITSVFRSDDLARQIREDQSDQSLTQQNAHLLSVLNQAASALIAFKPLDELLELIMSLVFDAIPAERGFLMLLDKKSEQLVPRVVWNRATRGPSNESIQVSRSITRRVMEEKASILISNAQMDDRFRGQESIILQGVLSAMCAPLWDENNVIGLVYVDSRRSALGFTNENLKVLTSLANVAAIKIENTRLLESVMEKQRIEKELALAGEIQRSLLPESPPRLPGYQITGFNSPSRWVGGDYYDFIPLPNGRWGIAIGDVSGKGISASLLMASLRASLISLAELQLPIGETLSRLNHFLCKSSTSSNFVTFFYGELDLEQHSFRYCNAGHNPPLLFKDAENPPLPLSRGGMVLGLIMNQAYQEAEIQLEPGDLLVLYTDGISEATDHNDEEFGVDRLVTSVQESIGPELEDTHSHLIQKVLQFQGDRPQADDMTLVMIRCCPDWETANTQPSMKFDPDQTTS